MDLSGVHGNGVDWIANPSLRVYFYRLRMSQAKVLRKCLLCDISKAHIQYSALLSGRVMPDKIAMQNKVYRVGRIGEGESFAWAVTPRDRATTGIEDVGEGQKSESP